MIVALALVAACLGGARGQSNAEYHFRQQSVIDGHAYNNNGDPVPKLSMDCLAANGYGQWTLTSTSNTGTGWVSPSSYPIGWYLLGNGLYAPSAGYDPGFPLVHPGCIPPGVVQNGDIANGGSAPPYVKAVANLAGWVAFVWPSTDGGDHFEIREFSSSDIDITLGFLANPHPPMNIISPTTSIQSYKAWTGAFGIGSDFDWRDVYDIAINGSNLFIVWKSNSSTLAVKVIPLGSGSDGTGITPFGPLCERPTIACDVRSTTNDFQCAWLTGHTTTAHVIQLASSTSLFSPTTLGTTPAATKQFIGSCSMPWTYPLHARVLQSSGTDQDPNVSVYAIVNFVGLPANLNNVLVFFDPGKTSNVTGYFIDGGNCPSLPRPTPAPAGYTSFGLADAPIVALADPYDNQSGKPWDNPFHCLYQLDYTITGQPDVQPIVIVKGKNVPETRLVLNQSGGTLLSNPDKPYVAAVNQMGIHVHFHTADGGGTHFYARDMNRTFDENIEENTLVTDECTVANGTVHGGTIGAQILRGNFVTVWTDPNYGASLSDPLSGLYQRRPSSFEPSNPSDPTAGDAELPSGALSTDRYDAMGVLHHPAGVGTLKFSGNGVKLLVGSDDLGNGHLATLTVMPYFYFDFPGIGQGVTVKTYSKFNYYGLPTEHPTWQIDGYPPAPCYSPFTNGTIGGSGGTIDLEGTSTVPALLYANSGSNLYIGSAGILKSNYASIDVDYGPDLYPEFSYNADISGLATIYGKADIHHSNIIGHYPGLTSLTAVLGGPQVNYIFKVMQSANGPSGQFTSSYNAYRNNAPASYCLSQLYFGVDPKETQMYINCGVSFDHDNFTAVSLMIHSPSVEGVSITNSVFDKEKEVAIVAYDEGHQIGRLTINNNAFGSVLDAYLYEAANGTNIYLSGFEGNDGFEPDVEANTMESIGSPIAVGVNGVCLDHSTAIVKSNIITSDYLSVGIVTKANTFDNSILTTSLICHNTISVADQVGYGKLWTVLYDNSGIWCADYAGFIKLNDIQSNWFGCILNGNNVAHFEANNIHNCIGPGISASFSNDIADLTGVHFGGLIPNTLDYLAYNNIHDNVTTSWPLTTAQIGQADDVGHYWLTQKIDFQGNISSWTVAGGNNIYSGSSAAGPELVCGTDCNYSQTGLDISGNYWGGRDPSASNHTTFWPCFDYTLDGGSPLPNYLTSATSTGMDCDYNGNGPVMSKGARRGEAIPTNYDTCGNSWALAAQWKSTGSNKAESFDTMRWVVMHCYRNADPDQTFSNFPSYPPQLATVTGRLQFTNWLLDTVMKLRSDDGWWCACVRSIPLKADDYRAQRALCKFLLGNMRCDSNNQRELAKAYDYASNMQYQRFRDTTPRSYWSHYDSTLPTIHDLGLDSLLKGAATAGLHYDEPGQQIIAIAQVIANPFADETSLSLTINREAYLHIGLFDLLGHKLEKAGYEGIFESGQRMVPLGLSSQPPGTYYLRISTANNEVRTIKLVKE